jgi:hypothetical protein
MQWIRCVANPCYHLILNWKWCLANSRRDDVSLLHISFNSTLESLPLQLCSQTLTGNSFATNRLGNLFSFLVLLIVSLPLIFLEMMTTLDVCIEVLVLVCSKLTPKLSFSCSQKCVNLEVLNITTNNNTNIYHPNTAIGDDVWLLCVSFNSTLESLPLQLCSQPLTGNSFAIDHLGNLPGRFLCYWSYPFLVFSIKR